MQSNLSYEFTWDSRMLENMFKITLNTEQPEIAWKEFEKYSKYQEKVHGELSEKCITNLFDAFLNNNQIDRSIVSLKLLISMFIFMKLLQT